MTTLVPQRGRRPSAGPWAPLFLRLAAHTHPAAGPRPQLWKGGSPSRSPSRGEKPRSPRCYASRSGAERGGGAHPPIHPRPRARGQENRRRSQPLRTPNSLPFPQQDEGRPLPADVGVGAGPLPLPPPSPQERKTSPSPSRTRACRPLGGADGVRGPLKKQQATPSSFQAGNADPLDPPAFHLGSRAKPGRKTAPHSAPLRHFIAPLTDLPQPEAAGPTPGVGQRSSDWQETAPPPRGWCPAQALQPRPPHRLPRLLAPPLLVSSNDSTVCCS